MQEGQRKRKWPWRYYSQAKRNGMLILLSLWWATEIDMQNIAFLDQLASRLHIFFKTQGKSLVNTNISLLSLSCDFRSCFHFFFNSAFADFSFQFLVHINPHHTTYWVSYIPFMTFCISHIDCRPDSLPCFQVSNYLSPFFRCWQKR
jgi:hypothetical protein